MRLRGTPETWIAALTGPSEKAWKQATMMMGGLDPDDPVEPQPFIDGLESGNDEVIFWSIIALARLRARSRGAVPKLIAVCGHKKINVREAALSALARIAPGDPTVKRAIFGTFRDRSPLVRSEALNAVIGLRNLDATDFRKVRGMLRDRNPDVRYNAEVTINNIKNRKAITVARASKRRPARR